MKKIKCTLSTLDVVIKEFEDYRKNIKDKIKTFMERLADVGIQVATIKYQNALYAGTNDVVVNPTPTWIDDNKLVISAYGSSITFIEFGTGVTYQAQSHPLASEFGYERGGYGYHLGRLSSWRYEGDAGNMGEIITEGKHTGEVRTSGNPANRSMYDASKQMREQIRQIAQEVFK